MLPPARRPAPAPVRAVTFATDLGRFGTAPALVADDTAVSYGELDRRVDDVVAALGDNGRRLVLLEASNDLPSIVTYLACLRGGHPVLVVPPDAGGERAASLVEAYDPDVVVTGTGGTWSLSPRREGSAHDLHPDLALLLSTSGSTGAPKLVRLSHENLEANAASIVSYLGLGPDDRAITSLPMAYCYGLSVINTHLSVGASLVLSERSVIDDEFWRTFARHGATSFAGVPHTFELLDRIGFADLHLPTLRYVTQAGGRLGAEAVQRYAELGRRRGWNLFVMYGQTEATARMAYLPPEMATRHPDAIGVAVPGGVLRLDEVDDGGVGELIYRGPNVMLGYASSAADLALGRTTEELRTGDLARVTDVDIFEVVGRRHRFVKPFGLRIDLDQVERLLRAEGIDAACAGDDRRLVVAAVAEQAERAGAVVHARTGLPPAVVHVRAVDDVPRLPSGKPDHPAVLALAEAEAEAEAPAARRPAGRVHALYADVFQRSDVGDDDTFASLGGDSLSYVELSVRLEETLGQLPDDWPTTTVGALERSARGVATATSSRPRAAAVETTVVLRAGAIFLIVATHAALVDLKGGAHLLLAVAGWNFARFQLPVSARRLASSAARIAVPTVAWIAFLLVFADGYGLTNLALVHTQVGEPVWDERWRFWFIETLVQALAVAGIVAGVEPLRRLERRWPFTFALALLVGALALRIASTHDGSVRRPQEVLWFFVLGWVVHRARSLPQKLFVTAVAGVAVHGFFGQPLREAIVFAGLVGLVWVRTIPIVRPLHRATATVAAASLAIYLTHWHVYPAVREWSSPALAVAASFVVGIGAHLAGQRLVSALRRP